MHCQDVVHALDVVVPAKVPQELQLAQQPTAGGIRSARDINGNLDWRCGHCNKVAREPNPRLARLPPGLCPLGLLA